MPKCAIITDISTNSNLNSEQAAYLNDLSLGENIISHIILYRLFQAGRLLDKDYREWVRSEFIVKDLISTADEQPFAYSAIANLYARYEMRTHGYIQMSDGSKWDGYSMSPNQQQP